MMNRKRVVIPAVLLVVLIAVIVLAWPYRYLALSKLNINPGGDENVIGLRPIVDIPLDGGATRFDYQSLDPQRRLLFIAHLGADQVVVFDLKGGKVIKDIPDVAGAHGVLAVPETGRVYAAATGTHQIDVIDEQTMQVVAHATAGEYPDGIAYDPENQKLFVSDESGGGVIVIDARTNQQTKRIDLGGEVGNTQYDVGGHQIISAAQGQNKLALIDSRREQVTASIDLPGCSGPHGFYVDSPSRTAFVSCEENGALLVVDLDNRRVVQTDSVGSVPDVLAYDPGLHRLYVAAESGVVAVFQTRGQALTKIGQSYLAPNAHTLAVDPQTHWVYAPLENINGKPILRIYEPTNTNGS